MLMSSNPHSTYCCWPNRKSICSLVVQLLTFNIVHFYNILSFCGGTRIAACSYIFLLFLFSDFLLTLAEGWWRVPVVQSIAVESTGGILKSYKTVTRIAVVLQSASWSQPCPVNNTPINRRVINTAVQSWGKESRRRNRNQKSAFYLPGGEHFL